MEEKKTGEGPCHRSDCSLDFLVTLLIIGLLFDDWVSYAYGRFLTSAFQLRLIKLSHALVLLESRILAAANGAIKSSIFLIKIFEMFLNVKPVKDHDEVLLKLTIKPVMEVVAVFLSFLAIEDLGNLARGMVLPLSILELVTEV